MSYTVNKTVRDDLEMQYIKFGQGERTAVILPGLSVQSVIASASAIERRYEELTKDFTVYLFDRRENMPKNYSLYDMASDTAKAMMSLNLSDVSLFGVSQGGILAMLIAADYPNLVKRLALGSAAVKSNERFCSVIQKWILLAKNRKAEKLYLSFGEKLYPEKVFNEYEAVLRKIATTVTENELNRFVSLAESLIDFDVSDKAENIKCPVLALGDSEDCLLGSDSVDEIAETMKNNPRFQSFTYRGFGHAVYDLADDFPIRLHRFFINSQCLPGI